MMNPSTIMAESGTLQALLKIISDPESVKANIDELNAAAKVASEATDKLVQEKVEYQNLKLQAEQTMADAQGVVENIGKAIGRAQGVVNDAIVQKLQLEAQGKAALYEARDLVAQMSTTAQASSEAVMAKVAEQQAKVAQLDQEIAEKEARLLRANQQLDELRGKLGVTLP